MKLNVLLFFLSSVCCIYDTILYDKKSLAYGEFDDVWLTMPSADKY